MADTLTAFDEFSTKLKNSIIVQPSYRLRLAIGSLRVSYKEYILLRERTSIARVS